MNQLNTIINKNEFIEGKLYLLSKPNNDFGFFYQDGIVYFGKRSSGDSSDSIDTSYLDLNMNIFLESDLKDQSFSSGYYDLLSFKGDLNDAYFDVFYSICNTYSNDSKSISFYDFFNSIVEIFKKNKGEVYKKVIGLVGELLLIKDTYEKFGCNIADNWHLTGTNSKFDFSFKNTNLEVKTTTKSDITFRIKHSQIFNNQNNFVGVVSLIETGTGESIESLLAFFRSNSDFKNNVKFQIALVNEYMKIFSNEEKNRGFALDSITYYSVKNMPTIINIPSEISKIEYDYDFVGLDESKPEEIYFN